MKIKDKKIRLISEYIMTFFLGTAFEEIMSDYNR